MDTSERPLLSGEQMFTGIQGGLGEEEQALHEGNRDAVIIMAPGFGNQVIQGGAHLTVIYNQSAPVTAAATKLAVSAIVDSSNSTATNRPEPVTLDEQAVSAKSLRTIDFVTPGMVGMLLMWANLTVAVQLVFWREQGITKRLAATPLAPIAMISGQLLARLLLSIVQEVVLIALAIWFFNVQIYLNEALRQIINSGAGWAAIQTSVLILLAWIVGSLLITWRAFRWQA